MIQDKALADAIHACTSCKRLVEARANAVPAMPGANYQPGGLAVWLDYPRQAENRSGSPDTSILSSLLKLADINRDDILLLMRVRCMPTRGRVEDYPEALVACDEWSKKELEYYNPNAVLLMGNTAARGVFGPTCNITAIRGSVRSTGSNYTYGARLFVPSFHPAAAIRNPELQSIIVEDMKLAKSLLH